jgi:hypothetical protein
MIMVLTPVVTSAPLWSAADDALNRRTGPPGYLARSGTYKTLWSVADMYAEVDVFSLIRT